MINNNKAAGLSYTLEDILNLLGAKKELIPDFPFEHILGNNCFYLPATPQNSEEEYAHDLPLSPSSMGKIWSNQGLLPIIKNPDQSVFQDCRYSWFTGVSGTARWDFVYYIDARNRQIKLYFRDEFSFFGEDRQEEVSQNFTLALNLFKQLLAEGEEGEIISHTGSLVFRKQTQKGYKNISPENMIK